DRLSLPVALPPQRSFLLPGFVPHLNRSSVSDSGLVTPSSVRSPSTVAGLSPLNATFVDLNVICGNSAALKKSAERKCSLRDRARVPLSLSPVSTEAVSMTSSTDPDFAPRSIENLPLVLPNRPYMVDSPR